MYLWNRLTSRLGLLLLLAFYPSAAVVANDDFSFEASWKAYQEIVVSIAGDFDSPLQSQALQVVQKHALSDSRFDDPVREAMKSALAADGLAERRQIVAIDLMALSEIDVAEQVAMLLDLLVVRSGDANAAESRTSRRGTSFAGIAQGTVSHRIASRLGVLTEPLAAELATRLAAEEPPTILYHAAGWTEQHGAALVPMLLSAVKSPDPSVQAAAFAAAGSILEVVRTTELKSQRAAASQATAAEIERTAAALNIEPKSLVYAQRIIERADKNGDGVLTRDEWKDMLLDPSAADADADGRITPEEYAVWLNSRSKR